jgi:LysM repeat protein
MPNTDFSSVRKHHTHRQVSLRKPLRCGFAIVLCSCLFYGAAQCRAQEAQSPDVAEAARQERARKEQTPAKHVYTDEDLRRDRILTPEDEARLAGKRKEAPPLQETGGASLDASGVPELPLGDVARLYRSARRATESPFHIPFDEPAFASPVEPIQPGVELVSPVVPKIEPSHPRMVIAPATPSHRVTAPMVQNAPLHRRDPFARRFVPMAPATPAVSAPAPVASVPNMPRKVAPVVPPVAPAANPVILVAGLRTVTVRSGDTLWRIAEENLGRGSRWPEVLAANPSVASPEALKVGMQINLPADVRAPRESKVRVNAGDTLSKIAEAQYGRAGYWRCIAEANPTVSDANRIFEGQELVLPNRCKP